MQSYLAFTIKTSSIKIRLLVLKSALFEFLVKYLSTVKFVFFEAQAQNFILAVQPHDILLASPYIKLSKHNNL